MIDDAMRVWDTGGITFTEENGHFVHLKSHMNWPAIRLGCWESEAGECWSNAQIESNVKKTCGSNDTDERLAGCPAVFTYFVWSV
jgi:hypothetical protein